jgi:chromosome segregation protein
VQRLREDCEVQLEEEYEKARQARSASEVNEPADHSDGTPACASGPNDLPPEEAQVEIDDLRKKLARLGSVNLDSLQELAELERRDDALRVQYDDLTAAQKHLLEIITTINEDSRRLFTETFALIRTNFQDLFRKLFGGGQADVILESEADVLESGIEVMARPPGKELRSISLMSGGEKTLTAVALLLAIFRSKPSPFCLLDEVDAALDEANTARMAGVLKEFLDRSQFIIVTHSKRTMSSADVLYGVTMQESGVSKPVAVKFEDWPDDEPHRRAA